MHVRSARPKRPHRPRLIALAVAVLVVATLIPLGDAAAQDPPPTDLVSDTASSVVANVTGRAATTDGAGALAGATVVAKDIDGREVADTVTGPDGSYRMLLPPDTYTLTATHLFHLRDSRSVEIEAGPGAAGLPAQRVDFELPPVGARATVGPVLPGARAEAGADAVVLENDRLAMALATSFEDGQLAPSTRGKPVDVAVPGLEDPVDWINLPYFARSRPGGIEAWQQTQVRTDDVHIDTAGPDGASVTATGRAVEHPDVEVTTSYTVSPETAHVTAVTTLTNTGATAAAGWFGDVIDVDESGSVSHVPGPGDITTPYGAPGRYAPAEPWLAQYGSTPQVVGLVYTSDIAAEGIGFTAHANSAWIGSERRVEIPPGGALTVTRDIVVAATDEDPVAPVAARYREAVAEATGLQGTLTLPDRIVPLGATVETSVELLNGGDEEITELTASLDLPSFLTADGTTTRTVSRLAPGETRRLTWSLTATAGGKANIAAAVTQSEARVMEESGTVFVDGPGWFPGDNHTHSTYSDGVGTIADNMAAGRARGLSFVTATDHNTIDQQEALPPEQREDFIALFGEEVTSGDGHGLAYNIDSLIQWTTPPQQRIDDTNASNDGQGFFYIAHPYYPGLEWEDYSVEDYAGIEVWNGFYPPRHPVNTQAFGKWDELNRSGMRLRGIANSDAHNPGKVASPHIRAYLTGFSEAAIDAAMEAGTFYGTDGPDLRFSLAGVRMGGVLAQTGEVTASIRAIAEDPVTDLRLIKNGAVLATWRPGADDVAVTPAVAAVAGDFFRVEVDTASGRFAFSNPVFVEG